MMVGCTLRDVWEEVRDATIRLLGGVTFADPPPAPEAPGSTRRSSPRSEPRHRDRLTYRGIVSAMAVAIDREYGLFIGGELTEPARARSGSSPSRRPASRSPARAWRARRMSTARSRPAWGPRRRWGKTPGTERARCTRSRMRSSSIAPSSPSSRRVTWARRSRRSRRSFTRRPRTSLLRLRHRDDRRAGEPDRRLLLFYSLKEPVGVAGQIVPWNYLLMSTWKPLRRSQPDAPWSSNPTRRPC